jgi:hypothetical protein
MKKLIVGIDPSINSTAMYMSLDDKSFTKMVLIASNKITRTKTGNLTKWFSLTSEKMDLIEYDPYKASDSNTDNQKQKIVIANKKANRIIKEIKKVLQNHEVGEVKVRIEGYSYMSATSSIIDLVSFGSIIRSKVLEEGFDFTEVTPSSLKQNSCQYAYGLTDIGKRKPKLIAVSPDGVKGGSFKKPHMLKAFLNTDQDLLPIDKLNPILSSRNVPKPIEDIVDSFFLTNTYFIK